MNRSLQQMIHVACRELHLDQDARRDLQLAVCGKASMRDMTQGDLKKVLDRLKADGFKPDFKGRKKHPPAPRPDLKLIHVLWKKLGQSGQLREPSRKGLNSFIRARFGAVWGSVPADIDMLRDWAQIDQVIQALKNWGQRSGIDFDWDQHRAPAGRASQGDTKAPLGDCKQSPAGRASPGDTKAPLGDCKQSPAGRASQGDTLI